MKSLKESHVIKNVLKNLQKELHYSNTEMNRTFPDLIKALEQEERDNLQKKSLLMLRKIKKKLIYY